MTSLLWHIIRLVSNVCMQNQGKLLKVQGGSLNGLLHKKKCLNCCFDYLVFFCIFNKIKLSFFNSNV